MHRFKSICCTIILSHFLIGEIWTEERISHSNQTRVRRYAIEGSYWGKNIITYKLKQHSRRMSLSQQREVFAKAFATWEEHTHLRFIYQHDAKPANIEIVFASQNHGDGEPFDGKGNILAHAFFPRYGGGVHFDEDEVWSPDKRNGVDLYAVAVHEIGHAIGLKHSSNHLSIMAPFYKQYTGEHLHLHLDDILAVRRLYGFPESSRKESIDENNWRREICGKPYIDAITQLKNGTILAFREQVFFEIRMDKKPISPRLIADYFPFYGSIDAVTTDKYGNVFIFKNNLYWILTKELKVLPRYPKQISEGLIDTPDKISAALHFDDGRPYFFQKSVFWQYSRHGMKKSWPRRILTLFSYQNYPPQIDAAVQIHKNATFIFYKNNYWKLSKDRMKVETVFPKSVSKDWFHC